MGLTNLQIPAWDVIGLGIPPTFGKIRFLVANKSTDKYCAKLNEYGFPDSDIYTSLALAYASMDDNQGDTLVVFPGDYVQTASLTWALNNSRLVGFGSPNQIYQPATLTSGAIRISNVTASVTQIINFTGHYVQVHNIGTFNNAGTANLADIYVTGRNFYASGCSFRGGNTASGQLDTNGAGVPVIVDATATGGGNGAWFDKCTIGSSGNGVRSKGPGCLKFLGPGANSGFGMHFTNCMFSARVEIATANNVGLVDVSGNGAVDREVLFDNCNFYNFVQNLGTGPTYVFRDTCGTTHQLVIHNSSYNKGFTSWSDVATFVSVSTPVSNLTGGLGLNA